jgi:hypothetical protein
MKGSKIRYCEKKKKVKIEARKMRTNSNLARKKEDAYGPLLQGSFYET